MYFLYSVLLALALVVASPYWLWQMLRHGKYRTSLRQRFGVIPARLRHSGRKCAWIHAVSVGEVLAISELARGLRAEMPDYRIVVSTTTDTGQKLAASRFGPDNVFYFPLDFAFAVRRWFNALKPDLVILAETEFWPNFLRVAAEQGARVAVVNARISDRSLAGYRRWKTLLRRVLAPVDVFLAQTPEDARRLTEIGAPAERVRVAGNLKFDVPPPRSCDITDQLKSALANSHAGPVLVCGSTVEGEEEILARAFHAVLERYPEAVMLLAPRHPERFEEVAQVLTHSHSPFARRSRWQGESLNGSILLVDSIGELASLYALATIAFVGGSLVHRGGHNIIEPAHQGVPILVGKHTENFRDIVNVFQDNDAVRVIAADGLGETFLRLLSDDAERLRMGRRAAAVLESQQGATRRMLQELQRLAVRSAHEAQPA
jgi:3-deoxy-D-manno-octulosonic-acid transferase